MPADLIIEAIRGTSPDLTYESAENIRFRGDALNLRNTESPLSVPSLPKRSLFAAAVVGNTVSQAVVATPDNDTFELEANDILLVDGGTDSQEAVLVESVDSGAGTVTGVFRRNHYASASAQVVLTTVRKIFRVKIVTAPSNSIANLRFFRNSALPAGVFDAFKLSSTYPGPPTDSALVSTASYIHARVPAVKTLIDSRVFTAQGAISSLFIEVQWLLTNAASNDKLPLVDYRWSWDES